jgi:tRNA uridine 5-carboxymethylaminomethyl modification enzyme
MGQEILSKAVVLTNGTFLNGVIHIGEKQFGGGRAGEKAAHGITEQLISLGFESGRMKTGTPPRIDGRSLHYDRMEIQHGDEPAGKFSYTDTPALKKQLPCHITYTNQEVHDTLKTGFAQSPMFAGRIQGLGPRYCPSIEDKINRFADKERHQLFIEPEGWDTCEIYVNGFSSSLPEEVQFKALKKIQGFEDVKMFRPGYAIEYDYFPPTQLSLSLETHLVKNLFFAGQINGTTGYEEAACQGLMAGINAHLAIAEREPFILKRSEGYIGVLVDDLVNKGTNEPYRMFTSRAEYRMLLRQDNADLRLTPLAHAIGIQGCDLRLDKVKIKKGQASSIEALVKSISVGPDQMNGYFSSIGSALMPQKAKLLTILLRPEISLMELKKNVPFIQELLSPFQDESIELAEIDIKYEGYLSREHDLVEKMNRLEEMRLIDNFNYKGIQSLSAEAREKLSKHKPRTIGQASRISGITPSDISILLVHCGR